MDFDVEGVIHDKEPLKRPPIKMGASSVPALKHIEGSQDTLFMDSDKESPFRSFGVFDGMGGHKGGAEAASEAVHVVTERFNKGDIDPDLTLEQAQGLVKSVLLEAHESIKDKQRETGFTEMGSTGTVGFYWEGKGGERKLVVGNVGDSSMYIFREGKLIKLTVDDDLAEVGKGNILTQVLGGPTDVEPRIGVFDLLPGDHVVAISDGVSDSMGKELDNEFAKALSEHKGNPEKAAAALVNQAREYVVRGGKDDDQTVVVVEIEGSSDNDKVQKPESLKEVKPSDPYRLSPGTMVRAKNVDGEVSDGWFVTGERNGMVMLKNSDQDELMISPEDLDNLNPPIEKSNWVDLPYAINQLPIPDPEKIKLTARLEEFMNSSDDYKKSKLGQSIITRDHGLRARIEELVALDAARKDLEKSA